MSANLVRPSFPSCTSPPPHHHHVVLTHHSSLVRRLLPRPRCVVRISRPDRVVSPISHHHLPPPPSPLTSADAPATTKSTFDNLKTLAWSAVTGTLPPVDIEARHKADVEAGAIRITDANFTDLIEGSEPDAVWIIFM